MKRMAITTIILLLGAVFLAGCNPPEKEAEVSIQEIREKEGAPVEVVEAVTKILPETIRLSGTVEAPDEVNVTPKVGGEIIALFKDKGDFVRKGEPLMQIEKKDYEIGYRQAKAAYDQAVSGLEMARTGARSEELVQVEAKKEYDCKNYRRLTDLYEKGVSTKQQLDGAETACIASTKTLEMAVSGARPEQIAVIEAQVAQAEAAVDSVKLMLDRTTVTSPVTGVISYRFAVLGQSAGPRDAIFQIIKDGQKKITFTVNEADLLRVKKGYEVTFKTAGASGEEFKAEVTYVSNHVRKMTREAEIEALVTVEPVKLAHGMFVEGEIVLGTVEAFAVPYKALIDNRYLMISVAEKAVRKMCENTKRVSDFVVITDGCIKPGDLVIVEGQSIIEEGNKVKIVGTSQY